MNIFNITSSRAFGPNGCQVPVGKGICGETRKLDIIDEFRMLYQKKMDEIEIAGGGDCLMEKLKLQEEWIDNLTEQNEMLVKVVEELEHEATERVHILEEKLQRSAQCICEVMNKYRQYDVSDDVLAEPLEKVFRLENDRKNLLEFLRRIREDKKWCTDGLNFFEISYNDLFGNEFTEQSQDDERYLISDIGKEQKKRKDLEKTVCDQKAKLEHFNSFGNVEFIAKELKCKQEECESLKQEMVDMRLALTEEVACKHDTILQLKKECQQLEDRCIQADKQTAFRDDIIKELRKEIKQLKQQISLPEKPFPANVHTFPEEKDYDKETCLVINHTKKIVQSGKSTIIYLRHNSNSKIKESTTNLKPQIESRKHIEACSKCKQKFENKIAEEIKSADSDEIPLHFSKSENDIYDFKKVLKPVKHRSKFTITSFNRSNTFVGSTGDVLKNSDFGDRLEQRNVALPNRIPVKIKNSISKERTKKCFQENLKYLEAGCTRLEGGRDISVEETDITSNILRSINEMQTELMKLRIDHEIPHLECVVIELEDMKFDFEIYANSYECIKQKISDLKIIIEQKNNQLKEQLKLTHIVVQKMCKLQEDVSMIIEIKDKQLKEQLELIKVFIKKLFNLNANLQYLETKVQSVKCECLNVESTKLKCQVDNLQERNLSLESNIDEDRSQIEDLEIRFKTFLKGKEDLKSKYRTLEKQCKCYEEQNKILHNEYEQLQVKVEVIVKDNEQYVSHRILIEDELKCTKQELQAASTTTEEYICRTHDLQEENNQLKNKLILLNEENRSLMNTIDCQKNKVACTVKLTQDEIIKLNETVDELQKNLHKSRKLQEEEEKASCKEICRLKAAIKDLQDTKQLQEENEMTTCKEICNLKAIIEDLENTNKLHEENEKTSLKEIKELKSIIDKLEKKVNSRERRHQIEEKEEDNESYQEIHKLKSVINELQAKINLCVCHQECEAKAKETEIAKLLKSIDNLKSSLNEADIKIKAKEENINKLTETIINLELNAKILEGKLKVCKICKRRPGVQFVNASGVQADLDDDYEQQLEEQMELLAKRDELIKVQTTTLNLLQNEIDMLKEQLCERDKSCEDVQCLKNQISELQNELKCSEGKCENLQTAIDLYLNSINILEATEAKCHIEITQQKATITNLQKALISVKQQLEAVKQKSAENELEELKLISNYTDVMCLKDTEKEDLEQYVQYISEGYESLQTFNLELELEHCDSLQDIDMLENQLYKYQSLLKYEESNHKQCKSQVKRLVKQKRCYEEVIAYFKQEMALMSDQLVNLQELLTLSYSSVQEENCRLNKAFVNVQTLNDQLAHQLCAAEQKIQLENQMNQLNETKICELERLVSEKELDLDRHDKAIMNIRDSLKCSLKQNEDLHETIVSLNGTISQLQNAIKRYDVDNCKSKESAMCCQTQIDMCKQKLEELKIDLEKKSGELCKLEIAYNRQNRNLRSAKVELQEMKERQNEKHCNLRCVIQELEEKFRKSEEKYKELMEDYEKVENQLSLMSRREAVKEVEIQRYRKIIVDLKKTLIDLNTHLTKRNFMSKCNTEECKKFCENTEEIEIQDIPLTCPCEVEFYQSIVDNLKKSVSELKQKLSDYQKKNQDLEEQCRCSQARFEELSKSQAEKDQECFALRQQLAEKLSKAQKEDTRYLQLTNQFEKELGSIRQELEIRTKQLDDVKRSANEISSCRCVQLACAQEECNSLKEEVNKLRKKQCALNAENQRLHQQSVKIQALEENRQLLKGQLEQYLMELQTLQSEKEAVVQKNHDLLNELRALQCSSNKQQRYANDSLKTLETELGELKGSRSDICLESKNIITYFRAWLEEQKKINEYISNKDREYRLTIKRLQQKNEELQSQCSSRCPQYYCNRLANNSPMPTCQSPWSLGSQGTASLHDSPTGSPCTHDDCDWYASNFKSYSEDDDDEDDWVSKVENLAEQVRKTNKIWKSKLSESDCCESLVSKDTKK